MRHILHHLVATELEAVDKGAVGAQVLDAHAALAEAKDGVDTADLRVINAYRRRARAAECYLVPWIETQRRTRGTVVD